MCCGASDVAAKMMMPFLLLLLLLLLLPPPRLVQGIFPAQDQGPGFDSRVRLLLVTGEDPKDGHLRFLRAAKGINLPAQMVVVKDPWQEISQVLEVIRKSPYKSDDVLVLTNSEHYLPTGEPPLLAWRVVGEALQQEAQVLISYPPTPPHLTRHLVHNLQRVEDELFNHSNNGAKDSSVKPRRPEDLLRMKELLQEQRVLHVKMVQELRKARPDTQAFRAYAFAGLAGGVEELLVAGAQAGDGTLAHLWHSLAEDVVLRDSLAVALDHHAVVFQDAGTLESGTYAYRGGIDGSVIVNVPGTRVAPLVYASPGNMAPLLANIVAREVGSKRPCLECPDEPQGRGAVMEVGDVPSVMVAVLVERPVPFFRLFLRRLHQLSFPKTRVSLYFCVAPSARQHLQEVEQFLEENGQEYMDTTLLGPEEGPTEDMGPEAEPAGDIGPEAGPTGDIGPEAGPTGDTGPEDGPVGDMGPEVGPTGAMAHQELWERAMKEEDDYLLLLEANAHLTNPNALQDLISRRRKVVGPLLTSAEGEAHNVYADYLRGHFSRGPMTDKFVGRIAGENDGSFSFRGLLQAAMVESAVLLSRQAYSFVDVSSVSSGRFLSRSFYTHLLAQGLIPYVSNEVPYGKLIQEEGFTCDFWNLERNEEEFYTLYIAHQGQVRQEAASTRGCEHMNTLMVFSESFAQDMLKEVEDAPWEDVSDKEEDVKILVPPASHADEVNTLAQSTIRSIFRKHSIQAPSTGGLVSVLKGPGRYVPGAKLVALVGLEALEEEASRLELWTESSKCELRLRVGEVAYFRRAHYPNVTLVGPITVAAMLL
ncbi:uncharacterized protein [Panulirus ornatus]|uniref:uncharacterized protein n=1 Tax=Panulirus ornatus TaxID=150431 RepID=UPI003A8B54F7